MRLWRSALLATTSSKRNTLTGTPYWMAPEVVQSVPAYDTKADIWSLGIMVYEMIKGTPPHSNLDKFQVMDLIPRIKPPRLTESEGSKDMRDFMSFCLKESPTERLPADELAKTKWIKSISKVGVSLLKDLVLRLQQAGPRASLAEPLDWENGDTNGPMAEDNSWEFDTIRGSSFLAVDEDYLEDFGEVPSDPSNQATIRANQSTNFPSSLRLLFEDGNNSAQPESRRLNLNIPETSVSSQFSPITPEPAQDDVSHQYTFPSMPITRNPSKPFLGNDNDALISSSAGSQAARSISPLNDAVRRKRRVVVSCKVPTTMLRDQDIPPIWKIQQGRRLSTEIRGNTKTRRRRSGLSIFLPISSSIQIYSDSPSSSSAIGKSYITYSPYHIISTHQNTLSLDAPSISTKQDNISPPIARTRSATTPPPISAVDYDALDRAIHVVDPRKASDLSLPAPSRGTPGLKDVLKVPLLSSGHHMGMADLLPPSPSAAVTGQRHFPSVSTLLPPPTTNSAQEEIPIPFDNEGTSSRLNNRGQQQHWSIIRIHHLDRYLPHAHWTIQL
ncbi:hypothetical protein BDZ97DRAFT_1916398 [Flammula alnicola]|nr:hypothetical protein BDZ97DRAFT_1916398 [Flammula alnicola]